MNTKREKLSIMLVLALIASLILPSVQITALAENIQTFTIEDQTLYNALKKSMGDISNKSALQSSDDEKQQITLDMEKVKVIELKLTRNNVSDNYKNTLEALFRGCVNVEYLRLYTCDLSTIDLTILNNRNTLRNLYLSYCKLDKIPELTLPNLQSLCLSQNNFSADGACDSLVNNHFPALTNLWLDDCEISDLGFLGNLEKLEYLSLADNRLTDESITVLAGMENLSGLKKLNLGFKVHKDWDYTCSYNIYDTSGNTFTDLEGLASLPAHFPDLEELELSGLKITSIQPFTSKTINARIIFEYNRIVNYTGLNRDSKFSVRN